MVQDCSVHEDPLDYPPHLLTHDIILLPVSIFSQRLRHRIRAVPVRPGKHDGSINVIETTLTIDDGNYLEPLPCRFTKHKHNNTIMTSFVSLPYELQYHILQYALPLEECTYDDWRLTGPMLTVRCTALNLVLALPLLKQQVVKICEKLSTQRKRDIAEYDKQCGLLVQQRFPYMVPCTCRRSNGAKGCRWCIEMCERWRDGLAAAGYPASSWTALGSRLEHLRRE